MAVDLTLRLIKGTELTFAEIDNNWQLLDLAIDSNDAYYKSELESLRHDFDSNLDSAVNKIILIHDSDTQQHLRDHDSDLRAGFARHDSEHAWNVIQHAELQGYIDSLSLRADGFEANFDSINGELNNINGNIVDINNTLNNGDITLSKSFTVQGTSFDGSADKTVTFTGGTGIGVSGTTITNNAPDQVVALSGSGGVTVTGTYPNFTIDASGASGTTYTAGSGLSLVGTEFANTAPDQVVSLTGAGGTSITGSYPNFTITSTTSGAPITYTAGNGLTLTGTEFKMSGSYTGTLTCTGDVVAFSDISMKSNINPIADALEKIARIGGYTYEKVGEDGKRTGVLAQEIQDVLPEAVHKNENGVLGVAYGNLTGLLIEAVKELTSKVDELESKLSDK